MIPRSEYPRPQLVRCDYLNLNGEWEFEIDNAKCGMDKEFFKRDALKSHIIVPFCPESELSGINNKDFMECVWYRRALDVPKDWSEKKNSAAFWRGGLSRSSFCKRYENRRASRRIHSVHF